MDIATKLANNCQSQHRICLSKVVLVACGRLEFEMQSNKNKTESAVFSTDSNKSFLIKRRANFIESFLPVFRHNSHIFDWIGWCALQWYRNLSQLVWLSGEEWSRGEQSKFHILPATSAMIQYDGIIKILPGIFNVVCTGIGMRGYLQRRNTPKNSRFDDETESEDCIKFCQKRFRFFGSLVYIMRHR